MHQILLVDVQKIHNNDYMKPLSSLYPLHDNRIFGICKCILGQVTLFLDLRQHDSYLYYSDFQLHVDYLYDTAYIFPNSFIHYALDYALVHKDWDPPCRLSRSA